MNDNFKLPMVPLYKRQRQGRLDHDPSLWFWITEINDALMPGKISILP